jgi:hypothetical protein
MIGEAGSEDVRGAVTKRIDNQHDRSLVPQLPQLKPKYFSQTAESALSRHGAVFPSQIAM